MSYYDFDDYGYDWSARDTERKAKKDAQLLELRQRANANLKQVRANAPTRLKAAR